MNIKTKYNPEEIVYLVHDPEQFERMVTEINVTRNGHRYLLVCGSEESLHYEFEITDKKDMLQKMKN